jgi:hypothetical protein
MNVQEIFYEIAKMSESEIINFLESYDSYVFEVCDREDGSQPVGIAEYFTNDYRIIQYENREQR